MDRKWLPLNALRAFEAAGQHLSFTAAANRLTVAQSAVSRHVIMLERFLNAPLFERRPQQLALTEAGKHLLPVVVKAFDRIDQALADIVKEKGNPRRVLKVALPPTFAHQLAVPLLKDFRAEHPEVSIDIASRRTRAGADGEADLSVIYSEPRVTDTVLDLLWMVRLTVLCSPALLKGGAPTDITTFVAGHDLLHVKLDDRPRHYLWGMAARAMARPDTAVDRGPVFDTAQLAAQYAMSGEGLALVDPMLFRDEIASGRLVRPFDFNLDDGYGYYLTTNAEDLGHEPIALFRSWLIRRFAMAGG